MILSSHGVIASQIASFDADALAFINAAGITDATQKTAINTLVVDLKGYSIWNKMKAIYPFVGGTSTTCKYNLKDPRDLDAAFRLVFNGGWTFASTGATPNGTNGYADTKLNVRNELTNSNLHLSFYSRTSNSTTGYDMHCGDANDFGIICKYDTSTSGYFNYGGLVSYTNTNSNGYYISSFISGILKGYKSNSNVLNTSKSTVTLPNLSIYIGADHRSAGAIEFSSKQTAFASIGNGLLDSEASNFYLAVQQFQQSLNRAV